MVHKHLHLKEHELSGEEAKGKQFQLSLALLGTMAGGVLLLNSLIAPLFYGSDSQVGELFAMLGAILLGVPILLHAVKSVISGQMHMDELVALAIIAAFASGQYQTAGIVAFFMLLSELMETRTALGARVSIESLIKLTPKKAHLVRPDGSETEVDVSSLKADDVIRVRPGDNIAADGEVKTGLSSVNEATITGESLPVDKVPGMQVFAGTTNLTGALDITVTKAGKDTTLGKVQSLIMQAEQTKIPIMRIIDRYVKWNMPTILMIAGIILYFTNDINRAIAALVVSCPCALILATPTAMVAALSASARLGILVKNVADLEIAGKMTAMVFDKTGTLTTGRLYVMKLTPAENVEPAELLSLAAAAELMSKHPAARAIRDVAKEAKLSLPKSSYFREVPGKGVMATISPDGEGVESGSFRVMVGRDSFLKENDVDVTNLIALHINEDQTLGRILRV